MLVPVFRVLFTLRIAGPRVRRARRTGLIIAPNHQSWVDPVAVQCAVVPHRITFLMTELYFDLPVAGLWFRAAGARPIREDGPSVSGLRAARDALEEGEVVCIFPEGEITTTGVIGRGQRGVARLARRTGAPVVPVGIHGAIRVFSKIQKWPRLRSIRVRLGEPMVYDETPDRQGEQRFTERLMERIRSLAE